MKALNKLSVILFTLCLILLSISLPTLFISTSKSYYKNQFIICESYPTENEYLYVRYIGGDRNLVARFTNTQIDTIIEHITDFLADKKESFSLQMDNVILNGKEKDGVDIFSAESVTHMLDVKILFQNVKNITTIISSLFILSGIYILYNRKEIKKFIFNYSLYTFWGLISTVIVFILFVIFKIGLSNLSSDIFFSTLWEYMHYIFFPFSPDKFSGSFFNDTLTMLLNIDFFMNTVKNVILAFISSTALWLTTTFLIQKLISKK